ncbi:hypothetical protein BpHYR1_013422, partial [Brachionus plicatilis]
KIFHSDLKQDIIRKSTETDLINFFLKFNIPIMNKKIPKIEYIKTQILKPEEGHLVETRHFDIFGLYLL